MSLSSGYSTKVTLVIFKCFCLSVCNLELRHFHLKAPASHPPEPGRQCVAVCVDSCWEEAQPKGLPKNVPASGRRQAKPSDKWLLMHCSSSLCGRVPAPFSAEWVKWKKCQMHGESLLQSDFKWEASLQRRPNDFQALKNSTFVIFITFVFNKIMLYFK